MMEPCLWGHPIREEAGQPRGDWTEQTFSRQCGGRSHFLLENLASLCFNICLMALTVCPYCNVFVEDNQSTSLSGPR